MSGPLRSTKKRSTDSPLRRHGGGPVIKREQQGTSRLASRANTPLKKRQQDNDTGVWKEYTLKQCSADDVSDVKHHLLRFHSKSKVVPQEQFTQPVRFHRKDPRNMQFQLTLAEQQERRAQLQEQQKQDQEQKQEDKKPTVDMSVVAPDGGARRQAQPFQKKTRQIYTMNETARQIRYEEYYPWVMEDFDGKNTWVGNFEAAQSETYVLFVFDKDGFKVVPADRFYKMTPRGKFATLTLEEAESRMEKKSQPSRWIMQHISQEQGDRATNTRRKVKAVHRTANEERDDEDMDYDEEFADDEEAPIMEGADDEVKEVEDKIKKEQRTANTIGAKNAYLEDEAETSKKIDKEGKRLRKYLRSLEKNNVYSSDDEDANPYASEEEEDSDDDLFNDKEEPKKIKKEDGEEEEVPKMEVREKKVYTNLPPGMVILQMSPTYLNQYQKSVWNTNAKRPREEEIQTVSKKIKTEKSEPQPPQSQQGASDADLLTEEDVRPIIAKGGVEIRELLKQLNPKLRKHPNNQKQLKMIIAKIAKLNKETSCLILKE